MRTTKSFCIAALFSWLLTVPAAADWQGTIETVGEGVVVNNPETPALGEQTLELKELWRRGGDDDDVFFGTVSEFLHDGEGNIYLLDGQLSEIQVFSSGGEWLRSVGREGEGPGEFRNGADMFWAPGGQLGVVQAWPGKIVMLTATGDPGVAYGLPYREGGGFQSVTRGDGNEERIVLSGTAWTRIDEKQMQLSYLKAYDAEGNELAHFHEASAEVSFGNYEFIEEQYVDFQRRWAMAPDGRVAAALEFDNYRIHVWNADGSLDRIIARPGFEPVKRTSEEKDQFKTMFTAFTSWNRGSTFTASDRFQAIGQLFFREDGNLWVMSSQGRWRTSDGIFASFDVYDHEGRFLRRVDLAADADATTDGLFFAGDRAYVVTDLLDAIMARFGAGGEEGGTSEAEPVEVVAYAFTPDRIAMTGKR